MDLFQSSNLTISSNNGTDLSNGQSSPSSPETNNNKNTMSLIADAVSTVCSCGNSNDDYALLSQHNLCSQKKSLTTKLRCSSINNCSLAEPKHSAFGNENVLKLVECRRKKRTAIREQKLKYRNIKELLEKQVHELEFKQNYLVSQIQNLQSYKQQLEIKCKQVDPEQILIS